MTTLALSSQNAMLLEGVENRDRQYQLNAFIQWLGNRHWLTVDLTDYRDYLQTRSIEPVTVNKYLEAVYVRFQAFTTDNDIRTELFAMYRALPADSPIRRDFADAKAFADETLIRIFNNANPKRLRVDETTIMHEAGSEQKRLTLKQVHRTLKTMQDTRDRAIFALLVSTGLRVEECRNLRVSDLRDSVDNLPAVAVWQGKGNKQRMVIQVEEWEDVFTWVDAYLDTYRLPDNAPLFQGYRSRHNADLNGRKLTTRAIEYIVADSPTPHTISPHALRHTYSSIMRYDFGFSEEFIQEQLGHDSIDTTRHYIGKVDKRALELQARQVVR